MAVPAEFKLIPQKFRRMMAQAGDVAALRPKTTLFEILAALSEREIPVPDAQHVEVAAPVISLSSTSVVPRPRLIPTPEWKSAIVVENEPPRRPVTRLPSILVQLP
jgi:hypothetical protein